ncbi:MAG: permease [Elusimicrobia bacterium]|nr:MAG: permease [Elusimicrobiota bacterium]
MSLLLAGVVTGAIGSVLGLGGGVFLVPALVLWFGIPIQAAAGAGLVAVIATSSAAEAVNVAKEIANIKLGMILETATVCGAITGGFAAAYLPARVLIGIFSVLLAIVTVLLWRGRLSETASSETKGYFPASYKDPALKRTVHYAVRRLDVGMTTAFFAGNLSGLLGVGGGVIKVPVLHLFCGLPMKAAAATSNFMIGLTGAAGAVVYFANGQLELRLSGLVALGVLAGSTGGAWVSRYLPGNTIRKAFSLLTLGLSLLMLRRSLGL